MGSSISTNCTKSHRCSLEQAFSVISSSLLDDVEISIQEGQYDFCLSKGMVFTHEIDSLSLIGESERVTFSTVTKDGGGCRNDSMILFQNGIIDRFEVGNIQFERFGRSVFQASVTSCSGEYKGTYVSIHEVSYFNCSASFFSNVTLDNTYTICVRSVLIENSNFTDNAWTLDFQNQLDADSTFIIKNTFFADNMNDMGALSISTIQNINVTFITCSFYNNINTFASDHNQYGPGGVTITHTSGFHDDIDARINVENSEFIFNVPYSLHLRMGGNIFINFKDSIVLGKGKSGGITQSPYGDLIEVNLENVTFSNLFAPTKGGGMNLRAKRININVEFSLFESNYAYWGASFYAFADYIVFYTKTTDWKNNFGFLGNAFLDSSETEVTISGNCLFSGNNLTYASSILVNSELLEMNITDTSFFNNSCETGGILARLNGIASINVERTTFENNQAKNGGPALSILSTIVSDENFLLLNVLNSTFNNNTATYKGGSCIEVSYVKQLNLKTDEEISSCNLLKRDNIVRNTHLIQVNDNNFISNKGKLFSFDCYEKDTVIFYSNRYVSNPNGVYQISDCLMLVSQENIWENNGDDNIIDVLSYKMVNEIINDAYHSNTKKEDDNIFLEATVKNQATLKNISFYRSKVEILMRIFLKDGSSLLVGDGVVSSDPKRENKILIEKYQQKEDDYDDKYEEESDVSISFEKGKISGILVYFDHENAEISTNDVNFINGYGMHVESFKKLTIHGGFFLNNSNSIDTSNGGALFVNFGSDGRKNMTFEMTAVTVMQNTAPNGAGIFLTGNNTNSEINIGTTTSIRENSGDYGSAFFFDLAFLDFELGNMRISDNKATYNVFYYVLETNKSSEEFKTDVFEKEFKNSDISDGSTWGVAPVNFKAPDSGSCYFNNSNYFNYDCKIGGVQLLNTFDDGVKKPPEGIFFYLQTLDDFQEIKVDVEKNNILKFLVEFNTTVTDFPLSEKMNLMLVNELEKDSRKILMEKKVKINYEQCKNKRNPICIDDDLLVWGLSFGLGGGSLLVITVVFGLFFSVSCCICYQSSARFLREYQEFYISDIKKSAPHIKKNSFQYLSDQYTMFLLNIFFYCTFFNCQKNARKMKSSRKNDPELKEDFFSETRINHNSSIYVF